MQLRPRRRSLALLALAIGLIAFCAGGRGSEAALRCLYVSSYHTGYDWSDSIERGLREVIDGHCEFRRFDMDTKRHKSEAMIRASALKARALIESWQPDVVIAADDNASKYLIEPYFRDHELPFVFCGVNWTVEEYGFPYSNVTGMIEVAPIKPLLELALDVGRVGNQIFYLGANTLSEEKNSRRVERIAHQLGMLVDTRLVDSMDDWIAAHRDAQRSDLVVLGGRAGIQGWDDVRAQQAVLDSVARLSVTNHLWMMPFSVLGMTKVAEEHGEWAGKTALAILDGVAPSSIPIVANSRRETWVNEAILQATGLTLPETLRRKAKKVARLDNAG